MDWNGLTATFRPLTAWPGVPTAKRTTSKFRSDWKPTLTLLRSEIMQLRPARVVVQMDLMERQIRADGFPRADARPSSPGVVLSLEMGDGGWMHFPCDTYVDWQDNVRGIALTLQALRAVARYGVTKKDEQYAGWKALPASAGGALVAESAAVVLLDWANMTDTFSRDDVLRSPTLTANLFRDAAKRVHPDAGGSTEDFQRVNEAKRVLDAHHAR